jgi:tryptophan synthase alpha chain
MFMNRIPNAFKNGKAEQQQGGSADAQVACQKKAFIGYLTAGDPSPDKTVEFIREMAAGGADLIEIGIPFSDPVADGPTIAAANLRGLRNGVFVDDVFEIIRKVRAAECVGECAGFNPSEIPIVILSYLNPVFFYGYEDFFEKCREIGVDGIIIPDLPFEESREVADVCQKYGVELIPLITPTSQNRIEMLAKSAKGFIYFVSSLGVTGIREQLERSLRPDIAAIKQVTDTPVAIGFGISRADQVSELAKYADGVIIGSAIVEIIEKYGDEAGSFLRDYVMNIKAAMNSAAN